MVAAAAAAVAQKSELVRVRDNDSWDNVPVDRERTAAADPRAQECMRLTDVVLEPVLGAPDSDSSDIDLVGQERNAERAVARVLVPIVEEKVQAADSASSVVRFAPHYDGARTDAIHQR